MIIIKLSSAPYHSRSHPAESHQQIQRDPNISDNFFDGKNSPFYYAGRFFFPVNFFETSPVLFKHFKERIFPLLYQYKDDILASLRVNLPLPPLIDSSRNFLPFGMQIRIRRDPSMKSLPLIRIFFSSPVFGPPRLPSRKAFFKTFHKRPHVPS